MAMLKNRMLERKKKIWIVDYMTLICKTGTMKFFLYLHVCWNDEVNIPVYRSWFNYRIFKQGNRFGRIYVKVGFQ